MRKHSLQSIIVALMVTSVLVGCNIKEKMQIEQESSVSQSVSSPTNTSNDTIDLLHSDCKFGSLFFLCGN